MTTKKSVKKVRKISRKLKLEMVTGFISDSDEIEGGGTGLMTIRSVPYEFSNAVNIALANLNRVAEKHGSSLQPMFQAYMAGVMIGDITPSILGVSCAITPSMKSRKTVIRTRR
jgi:hypothetical protein